MLITRSGILRECLEEANRQVRKYSRHENGLLPLEGYENMFTDMTMKCAMLRVMILEAESREAETQSDEPRASREVPALAQWQKDLMDGKMQNIMGPNMVWNPETQEWVEQMTPDEALLRRRYRKAEEYKPAPVVYPGGEEDGPVQD